jgi:polysaccharide biosynthesis transport protein
MAEQNPNPVVVNRLMPPMTQRQAVAADALTGRDAWVIVRRHLLLIISLTILGLILGGTAWYLLLQFYPSYTAQAFIRVLPAVEKNPVVIGSGVQVQKDIQYGYRLSMAALMKEQNTLQKLVNRDKIQGTEWFKSMGDNKDDRINHAIKDLKDDLGINPQRDGEFIVVSMTCRSAKESADIVNEMVDLFLNDQGGSKRQEVSEKLAQRNEELNRVQRDLDAAEKALDEVRNASGFTDLEEHQFMHTITLKLNKVETDRDELVLGLQQVKASIESLERQATGPVAEQVKKQIESDPTIVLLNQQIVLLEAQLAGRLTKFGENHRIVRQTQETIGETKLKIEQRKAEIAEQTRQANLKDAKDQMTSLMSRLDESEKLRQELNKQKQDLDMAMVQYEKRKAVRDERKQTLDDTKKGIETLKIMLEDPETAKVQKVSSAPVPLEVSFPQWQIFFPGGTMFGLMLGIGLAFMIEMLNDLVRTPRDIGRYLHIPLLGVIPDADEDDHVDGVDLRNVVRLAPYSIISESYRRLRTNLKLSASGETSKVLLVSSGNPGDGKTSVAVNLATAFIVENKKVLLVDANFWRPDIHTIFPNGQNKDENAGQSEFGLSTLLTGLCGYKEIIRSSGVGGFDLIDSGPLPSNPAELLGGPQMKQLIRHQRDMYDYIIIDGPPVLLVSDAQVLARVVDGTMLVFNANTSRRGAALRTIRELREVNATLTGCVLLGVKAMKGGYFAEQFRSYQEYQKLQLAHSF